MTAVPRIGGGVSDAHAYVNITTQTTTLVLSGPGELCRVIFNNPVATSVITIYDSVTASGNKIGTITLPASPQPMEMDFFCHFTTGLCIVTATASSDITVTFRP